MFVGRRGSIVVCVALERLLGEEAVAELCFYGIGLGGLLLVLAVGGRCSLFLCLPLHVCNVLRMVRCINWSFLKPARVFQT